MDHEEENMKENYPRLMVSTRWEAEEWCHEYDSVLTLFTPASLCQFGHPDQTVIEFADRYHYEDGAPTMEQFTEIVGWAMKRREASSLLVHCKAGQSRSTAAAISMFVAWGMDHEEAVSHVYSNCRPPEKVGERPFIPNVRILEHLDDSFGTDLADKNILMDAPLVPEWMFGPEEEWEHRPMETLW